MNVLETQGLPVKFWIERKDIEDGAMNQIINLANLPFAYHHVAIMPDVHQGYGMPIGGVLATQGVVIPNAVGVDIGCGMCAVKTNLTEIDTESLKKMMGEIRKVIPVGFARHPQKQDESLMPRVENSVWYSEENLKNELPICGQEYQNALTQIGTLGSGNHFIEIQKGNDGHIWIMIHSGSRNLGKQVADYYDELAQKFNKRWYSSVPKEWKLAFLPLETQEAKDYVSEMQYCVDFALANRKLMMNRIIEIFVKVTGNHLYQEMINIAHNYASMENHFGKNVLVHRKGATLAREGTVGIIPGSQGTKSYIVQGKGNKDSFESCSHGSGRKMGRKEAQRTLNLEEEKKRLDDMGVIHGIRSVKELDEAAGAYKDIEAVMKNQTDLVDILVELTPIAVIKG